MRPSNVECTFGNKEKLSAERSGEAAVEAISKNGDKVNIILSDVLYVPGLPQRMFSTEKMCRSGGEFLQSARRQSVLVMPNTETTIPLTRRGEFLWLVPHNREHIESSVTSPISSTVYAPGGRETASASLIDWHETLGHPHPASITFLEQRGLIEIVGDKKLDDFNYRICKETKSTVPHYQRGTRSIKRPGEVVHVDLLGPFTPDMDNYTYLMVFIDEATRYKSACGLRTKDQAYTSLKPYVDAMQSQGMTIVTIRGDGAGELGRSSRFKEELKGLGLKWESTPPYTHQQQGLVERAIRQIVEGGRTQLTRASLGDEFWTWACKDFAYKSNCIPYQALGGDSPFERLHPGRKPRYQVFRKFGQTAYVHINKERKGQFSRGSRNTATYLGERKTFGVVLFVGSPTYVTGMGLLSRLCVTGGPVAGIYSPLLRNYEPLKVLMAGEGALIADFHRIEHGNWDRAIEEAMFILRAFNGVNDEMVNSAFYHIVHNLPLVNLGLLSEHDMADCCWLPSRRGFGTVALPEVEHTAYDSALGKDRAWRTIKEEHDGDVVVDNLKRMLSFNYRNVLAKVRPGKVNIISKDQHVSWSRK